VSRLNFLSAANLNLAQAIGYYNERSPVVARDFLREVRRATTLLLDYPQACPIVRGEVRQKVLRRFPFSVLYMVEDDRVIVVAIMHQHRRPDYWHARIK
jgi:plasmid stabilization system protein ParE